jgi:hypothetical protein
LLNKTIVTAAPIPIKLTRIIKTALRTEKVMSLGAGGIGGVGGRANETSTKLK